MSSMVLDRLRRNGEGAPALAALQEDPQDPARQADTAAALRQVLQHEREFAARLEAALQEAQRQAQPIHQGAGSTAMAGNQVSMTGKGHTLAGRDITTNRNKTIKRGGAFWGVVAAVIVALGGGSTILLTQDDSDPSLQEQAEKTAVDFTNASWRGDIDTMCGLVSKDTRRAQFSMCESEATKKEAQEAADKDRPEIEKGGRGKDWRVRSSKLPSDNNALVTMVHATMPAPVTLHMTHETGAWRVYKTTDAGQR
ncbi:hypothetical protein ABZV77_10720 [Streptomyces sp. NPDC004732]|uniref:hypothetical protein n=1 Tax=Streptomyces sp. NPDC004732 TaxID=3154290 RepID=UPI0033B56028